MKRFLIYRAPTIAYMALVFALSANPMPEQVPDYWQIDKLYHFSAYLVMGALWARALFNGRAGRPAAVLLVAAVVITVFFGGMVEVYQSFLPYRTGDILDALANGAGGLAGVVLFARLKSREARPTKGFL